MRLIDADKLYPDILTDKGVAISQSQIANAETIHILDKIIAEIRNDRQLNEYPASPFACGLRRAMDIIEEYNK